MKRSHQTADLPRPPALVTIAGRVIAVEDGALRVADEAGEVRVAGAGAKLGDIVAARGTWDGLAIADARVEVLTPFRGARFPDAAGDWWRLRRDGGRRMALLRARAEVVGALREHFDGQGFVEVETPERVPSPGLEPHLVALPAGPWWLNTSPEYQMKRLLSAGMERIWQLGHCFRGDERGAHHSAEFTMAEWYRAYASLDAIAADLEALLPRAALRVAGSTRVPSPSGGTISLEPPFARITVREAFRAYAGADADALDEDAFFRALVESVEPRLGRDRPALLCEWPARYAALARRKPEDPTVALRFELYAGGFELANAFDELCDPVEQRERLEADRATRRARGLAAHPIDEKFLAALGEGMPPSAGVALGVDRLVMLVTGAREIRDVQAFATEEL